MKSILRLLVLLLLSACQEKIAADTKVLSMQFPGIASSKLPVLTSDGENLLLSYVANLSDSTDGFFYTQLENMEFSNPQLVSAGTDWFVNWADFPAIVQNQGSLLAHILQKSSSGTYSYDVKLQVRPEGIDSWETGLPLHQDSTLTEHGFVSLLAYSDSSYFVTWLDGRYTGGGHGHTGHNSGAMSIRAAEVDLQGNVLWEELLDAKTCDCCQTSAAMTSQGPIVAYRNRSDREIRDIAVTRLVDGHWTEPRIVHPDGWGIKGCPVNGPKIAGQNETVLVAWFTDVNQTSQVKLAFSDDAGANFGEPQLIGNSGDLGRVDVAVLDDENGLVSWMGMENDLTFLFAKRVNKSGDKFPARRIASMSPIRKSGFPQMEVHKGKVYFAWTAVEEQGSTIELGAIPIDGF